MSYRLDDIIPRDFLVVIAAGLVCHILFGVKTGSYAGSVMLYFFMGVGLSLTQFGRYQGSLEYEQAYYDLADSQQDYLEQ